jgi:hypothetical protein
LREANARVLRRRRWLDAIFRRGGLRLILQLLEELVRHDEVAENELEWRLGVYAELDPAALSIVGGDRLVPLPIRAVGVR